MGVVKESIMTSCKLDVNQDGFYVESGTYTDTYSGATHQADGSTPEDPVMVGYKYYLLKKTTAGVSTYKLNKVYKITISWKCDDWEVGIRLRKNGTTTFAAAGCGYSCFYSYCNGTCNPLLNVKNLDISTSANTWGLTSGSNAYVNFIAETGLLYPGKSDMYYDDSRPCGTKFRSGSSGKDINHTWEADEIMCWMYDWGKSWDSTNHITFKIENIDGSPVSETPYSGAEGYEEVWETPYTQQVIKYRDHCPANFIEKIDSDFANIGRGEEITAKDLDTIQDTIIAIANQSWRKSYTKITASSNKKIKSDIYTNIVNWLSTLDGEDEIDCDDMADKSSGDTIEATDWSTLKNNIKQVARSCYDVSACYCESVCACDKHCTCDCNSNY